MRILFGVLLVFFSFPILVKSLTPSLNDDVLGLIVFKADIQHPDGKLSSWNEDDVSPCDWVGVKCNPRSNRVSDLVLDGFGLSGKLGRGLLKLQLLRKLSLAKNNLTGSISIGFAQLSNLRVLDLSENSLSGSISNDFFRQCGSLRSVSLANNKFSGHIPESLGMCSTLASLNFSGNQFSGSLPSGLWSLHGLRMLDLSDNLLEGEIPNGIEGMNNLRGISLRKNRFTGEVPEGIGDCFLLRSIDLSENSFSGGLPNTMQQLTLCNNLLFGKNGFTREVPEWIGEMRSLETLDLSENNLTGQVPDSLGKLLSLKVLNVSKNSLTGLLPESMKNCVNLLTLDISHNYLTGELPSWPFELGLQQLLFSDNRLSGSVDNTLASSLESSRHKLVVLDISKNQLSGEIPSSTGDFSNLHFLNMSKNSFVGSIPARIGQLKILETLDLSDNQLNGSIPLEIGGATSLEELWLEKNLFEGNIPTASGSIRGKRWRRLLLYFWIKMPKNEGKVHHDNLVALEGYYWTPSLQLLIYEYVSGGNLHKHLHEESGGNYLSWNDRFNIILGAAKGLTHLHQMNLIHYNIKSSNILIDNSGEPKLADYSLARLLPMLDRYILSSKIQSALGYMAPEFACKTVKITEKCDVYGFGVLVLEVVTGKRPVEYLEDDVVVLCDMVRGSWEEGRVEECIDSRLQGKFPVEEGIPMIKLGLFCTSQVPSNRPDMAEVVSILELIRCPSGGQIESG
ncbi:probable LRR receptor-like serine/threonine-protein kinase IRK [Olea europaea var. sylvestris]|uniref:probable LRR receptor-like serine/threonine-protein kinase IRK n=1 Tax=Olea europaea var. sylvestris TaxID=158386 RepID=UPI000C1D7374|nr:probable LRR receptor-like serine/threonine-protein kinase IRK [Olea europaea var. sylvestris]